MGVGDPSPVPHHDAKNNVVSTKLCSTKRFGMLIKVEWIDGRSEVQIEVEPLQKIWQLKQKLYDIKFSSVSPWSEASERCIQVLCGEEGVRLDDDTETMKYYGIEHGSTLTLYECVPKSDTGFFIYIRELGKFSIAFMDQIEVNDSDRNVP